jgi:hypothetical protein
MPMTMSVVKRSMTLALAAAAVLAMAACGSSGGSSATTTESASSAPAGTTGPDQSVTVDTNFSGQGSSDLCSYAKQLEESGTVTNLSTASKADFEKFKGIVKNIEDKAPDEIKGDVQTYEKFLADLQTVFEKYNYDTAKIGAAAATDPDVQKVLASINDPDFTASTTRLDAYFKQVCGLTPTTT